ncbi:MAG: ParB/RepB/Spo0J family partition protein [Hydrococcus sp. RM1_1_31]|nr:ParB/RepB/Spo0J family partition protein [Hydrococcus sp. RM1_1_31]
MTRKKLTEAQQTFLKTGSLEANPIGSNWGETEISLSQLISWSKQPRKYFPPSHIEQLALSIRRQGVNYPLIVRPVEDRYEVIVGECRHQACHVAPHDPVRVKIQPMDDQQALELALSENLDRQDLNPIEVLDSLLQLLVAKLQVESEKSVCSLLYQMKRDWESQRASKKEIAPTPEQVIQDESVGDIDTPYPTDERQSLIAQVFKQYGYHWYSYTCNQLKLRDLPEDLYNAIALGKIEYSKGLKFKSIKDDVFRSELLEKAIQQGWSQREIQQKIQVYLKEIKLFPNSNAPTPQQQLKEITFRMQKVKPWKANPNVWQKIQRNLTSIEKYLQEIEIASKTP